MRCFCSELVIVFLPEVRTNQLHMAMQRTCRECVVARILLIVISGFWLEEFVLKIDGRRLIGVKNVNILSRVRRFLEAMGI